MTVPMSIFAASHTGVVRSENQDALLCRPELGLFVVADGAGGHEGGKLAAERVVACLDALPAQLAVPEQLTHLRHRLAALHVTLLQEARQRSTSRGMASTVVALLLDESFFACVWAGDSRLYLLRDGTLTLLTRDHSVVQELLDAGAIEHWEADGHVQANVITRAIGAGPQPLQLDKRVGRPLAGDLFLLCSDGLTRTLDDAELRLCLEGDGDVAARLVAAAVRRQARDNVTAIVVSVG